MSGKSHRFSHCYVGVAGSLLCLFAGLSEAAGLSLQDFNSVSALGSAGAGRGVNHSDASVISSNPAGMAFLDKQQFVLGVSGVFSGGEAQGKYHTASMKADHPEFYGWAGNYSSCQFFPSGSDLCYRESGKTDDFLKPAAIPSIYYAQPVNEQLWLGLGVYGSFGGETHYPVESVFRYQALDSGIKVVNLQPSLSWKVTDTLSVGSGLWLSLGHMEMSKMLNPWSAAITDARADLDASGMGAGLNLGLVWKPLNPLTVGLSYHSPVKIRFTGDMKATGVPGLTVVLDQYASGGYPAEEGDISQASAAAKWLLEHKPGTVKEHIKSNITFPEHLDLSLSWELNRQWTLLSTVMWTHWSRMKTLEINTKGGPAGKIVSTSNGAPDGKVIAYVPQDWRNTWRGSLGGHWHYSDRLTLRAGLSLDKSPTSNHTRTARIPDNDRRMLTVGANYRFDDHYTIDLAYGYMKIKPFSIHDGNHKVNGTLQGSNEDLAQFEDPGRLFAKYKKMHANILAAQLTVRF